MADKKTELMAQFYADCQQKGYTDMTDDTQSLKAKVIATDLKLNYGNIKAFYEKSKTCYEQVQAEKTEAERLKAIQQQKDAQERTRRQVNGELLVTLSDRAYESDETTSVRVYIRPDNSVYSTVNNGSKIEGAPKISIKQGGVLLLTYHPSQAVYTGATVGGITTGGVHYTQSGYTASKTYSGTGDIEISVGGRSFTLRLIKMSGHTCNLFKRDGQFTSLVHNREINCYVESDTANLYYESIKTGRLDHQTMMNALSMAADEQRLSYAMCERITHLLGRVVHGQFPPSDEQIYDSAKALENASTSAELNRAVELFNSILDYKDSAKQAQATYDKYEEVLQTEKELAVLEKEARAKKNKKIAAIVMPILVVLIVAAVIVSNSAKKSNAYDFALSLVASGQYEDAIEQFAALGDYKDCAEQIQIAEAAKLEAEAAKLEEQNAKAYAKAIALMEAGKHSEAYAALEALGDYMDSKELLSSFEYRLVESNGVRYKYDAYGNLVEENHGSWSYYYQYEENRLVWEGTSGSDWGTTTYTYYADGTLKSTIDGVSRNSSGAVTTQTVYYNENGYPETVVYERDDNPNKHETWKLAYTISDIGSITSVTCSVQGYGETKAITKSFDFVDHDGFVSIEIAKVDSSLVPPVRLTLTNANKTYTEKCWITYSAVFNKNISMRKDCEITTEYDSSGRIASETTFYPTTKGKITKNYSYDNQGNVIEARSNANENTDKKLYVTTYTYGYIYCPDAT